MIMTSMVRTDRQNKSKVSHVSLRKLMERLKLNAANEYIQRLRDDIKFGIRIPRSDYDRYHRIYPSARLKKSDGGSVVVAGHTGVLLLSTGTVADTTKLEQIKQTTGVLPSTIAAFTGLEGNNVKMLVSVSAPSGVELRDEDAMDIFYRNAYETAASLYTALLGMPVGASGITDGSTPLMSWCHISADANPLTFDSPSPLRIRMERMETAPMTGMMAGAQTERTEQTDDADNEVRRLCKYLSGRYEFRFNRVRGTTEYLDKERAYWGWRPTDMRFINGVSLDVREAGINARPKDVAAYLNSSRIVMSDPVEEYLNNISEKWDGHDYIGDLASTVKTNLPQWRKWFRMWFLGMVAQWMGYNRRYGNSIVPLLISPQGYHKSTFCRQLLPPQLRWGYLDNLKFDNQKQVMMSMSDSLLINIDEFNSISKKTQEGFLKNTIQLASIALKRPYARHIEQERRRASFIATSNMTDVLSDPSGSRRFFAVELTSPIDTDITINYDQLYAQAVEAVRNRERSWFDDDDIEQVMAHNRKYALLSSADMYFHTYFEPAEADDADVEKLTATEIYDYLRKAAGASAVTEGVQPFGRYLSNLIELTKQHTRNGTVYLVKKRRR